MYVRNMRHGAVRRLWSPHAHDRSFYTAIAGHEPQFKPAISPPSPAIARYWMKAVEFCAQITPLIRPAVDRLRDLSNTARFRWNQGCERLKRSTVSPLRSMARHRRAPQ